MTNSFQEEEEREEAQLSIHELYVPREHKPSNKEDCEVSQVPTLGGR